MKKKVGIGLLLAGAGILLPFLSHAQDDPGAVPSGIQGLQGALETVYDGMSSKPSGSW